MNENHKKNIDQVFGRTMMWVMLCVVVIAAITYTSKCNHSTQTRTPRGEWQEQQLHTLEDSIHAYEDGF